MSKWQSDGAQWFFISNYQQLNEIFKIVCWLNLKSKHVKHEQGFITGILNLNIYNEGVSEFGNELSKTGLPLPGLLLLNIVYLQQTSICSLLFLFLMTYWS